MKLFTYSRITTLQCLLPAGFCILLFFGKIHATAAEADPFYFTTLAGQPNRGGIDGTGHNALFNYPYCVIVDHSGNLLVADTYSHTIRRVSRDGVVTTLAGLAGVSGSTDGAGRDARFHYPSGLAIDNTGSIYVADSKNHTIRRITADGIVTTIAGSAGNSGSADGMGDTARFNIPFGLACNAIGEVFIADSENHTIRKLSPSGLVTTIAGSPGNMGSTDGTGNSALFSYPQGLTIDAADNLYVADAVNRTIRRITPQGAVTTIAGSAGNAGSSDGTGNAARFTLPFGVTVDAIGNLYVSDGNNTIRKIAPGGVVTTLAGAAGVLGWSDGNGSEARFNAPWSIAVDGMNTLYVADSYNSTIRAITPTGMVTTLAGAAESRGTADGTGKAARFDRPMGAAINRAGTLYVTDSNNNTIRRITPEGVVSTLAGKPKAIVYDSAAQKNLGGFADGTGGDARFYNPLGLTVANDEIIYVADSSNHIIRRITPAGVVTTFAGTPELHGSNDGTGQNARFFEPADVVVDESGKLYVADARNHLIRRITPSGVVTTLAGSAGLSGSDDGAGDRARFFNPSGVALDSHGNLLVADTYNYTIRRITPNGVVTTIAGQPGIRGSVDGKGSEALFGRPTSLTVSKSGDIYVVDSGNQTFRRITQDGEVTTIAGAAGTESSHADGIGDSVRFFFPESVAMTDDGYAYITDSFNNTIRQGQLAKAPVTVTQPQSLTVARGATVQFSVTAAAVPAPTYQWYVNNTPFTGATTSTLSFTNANTTDAGDYSVVITNELGSTTSNIAKLTVTGGSTPATPAPSGGSNGGGGGGSPSLWFVGALTTLWLARRLQKLQLA